MKEIGFIENGFDQLWGRSVSCRLLLTIELHWKLMLVGLKPPDSGWDILAGHLNGQRWARRRRGTKKRLPANAGEGDLQPVVPPRERATRPHDLVSETLCFAKPQMPRSRGRGNPEAGLRCFHSTVRPKGHIHSNLVSSHGYLRCNVLSLLHLLLLRLIAFDRILFGSWQCFLYALSPLCIRKQFTMF